MQSICKRRRVDVQGSRRHCGGYCICIGIGVFNGVHQDVIFVTLRDEDNERKLLMRFIIQSLDKEVIGFLFTCIVCTPEEKCVSLCCCTRRVVLVRVVLVLNLSAVWSVTGWVSVKWSSHAVAVVTVGLMIPCKLTCWCGEQTPLFSLDCLLQTVFKGAIYKF